MSKVLSVSTVNNQGVNNVRCLRSFTRGYSIKSVTPWQEYLEALDGGQSEKARCVDNLTI